MKHLRIASRKSDLARIQAYSVGERLQKSYPDLKIEYLFSASAGDLNLDLDLSKSGEKGLFTADLNNDLKAKKFEMIVHSWKDLPTDPRPESEVVATWPREDQRDVILIAKKYWPEIKSSKKINILTSSPRRVYNLSQGFKDLVPTEIQDLEFSLVRGNIPTRLNKLFRGDGQALVVAKAALDRLMSAAGEEFQNTKKEVQQKINDCFFMVLPLSLNPNAAAQGALAIEILRENSELKSMLQKLNSESDFQAVEYERQKLSSYGGGCHQKIGVAVLKRDYGDVLFLKGLTEGGEVLDEQSVQTKLPEFKNPFPKAMKEVSWFERKPVSPSFNFSTNTGYLPARKEAWSNDLPYEFGQTPVWVSGLKSWQKMASLGIWVHGCSDGLGEAEAPNVDILFQKQIDWCKLTHQLSPSKNKIVTYELTEKDIELDLSGYDIFFWASSTLFEFALKKQPEILKAHHVCAPGLTYQCLKQKIPASHLHLALGFEDWLQKIERE